MAIWPVSFYHICRRKTMNAARMTFHSKSRMKTRCGTGKAASQRLADAALAYGAAHSEVNGQLNRYFTKVYLNGTGRPGSYANNLRAYGDKLYVFQGDVLITVLQLPSQFIPQVKKITENKRKTIT